MERPFGCVWKINWVTKWPNGLIASTSWIALRTSVRDKAVGGTMCSIIIRWMLGFERCGSQVQYQGKTRIERKLGYFGCREVGSPSRAAIVHSRSRT